MATSTTSCGDWYEFLSYILVLDDDATTREVLSRLLTEEGYEVRAAADGAAALTQLAVQQPTVILLDQRVLDRPESEFLRWYRETPGPHAPVIVVTTPVESIEAGRLVGRPTTLLEVIALIYQHTGETKE